MDKYAFECELASVCTTLFEDVSVHIEKNLLTLYSADYVCEVYTARDELPHVIRMCGKGGVRYRKAQTLFGVVQVINFCIDAYGDWELQCRYNDLFGEANK